jgi:ribosomal protein L12E/L44/L45/RPP1/RPP2
MSLTRSAGGASHPLSGEGPSGAGVSRSPSTAPGARQKRTRRLSATDFEHHARREKDGAAIRAGVARGLTVREAGRAAGLSVERTKDVAKFFGIKSNPEALSALRASLGRKNVARLIPMAAEANRKRAAEARAAKQAEMAQRAPTNPFRSAAQNEQIERHKNRMWGHNPKLAKLPPVTDDEAERLVRDFMARRGVTVCQPAAPMLEPINAGLGWR